MAKKLKVSMLTQENFKEFGRIISGENRTPDGGDENFNWWEKLSAFENIGTVSINVLEAKKRALRVEKLEHHQQTPEVVIPLGGQGVIVIVAPAGELDESQIKAFYLDAGKGIVLNTGVRHFIPYPVEKNVHCAIIFKDATGANDLIFERLSEVYEIDYK